MLCLRLPKAYISTHSSSITTRKKLYTFCSQFTFKHIKVSVNKRCFGMTFKVS